MICSVHCHSLEACFFLMRDRNGVLWGRGRGNCNQDILWEKTHFQLKQHKNLQGISIEMPKIWF